MKKLNLLLTLLITIALGTLSSCSTSDDGGDGGDAPSGLLIADVSGKSFQSFEQSSSATIANSGSIKTLIIIATNTDGNAISMTVFGYEGPDKTYDFTGATSGVTNVASYSETEVNLGNPLASKTELWQAPYNETKLGSISISEDTETHLTGTFNFKGKNVGGDNSIKTIEGSFNLQIQYR